MNEQLTIGSAVWSRELSKVRVHKNGKKTNKCSEVAETDDRLATIDVGRKVRGCCAPFCERIGERRKPKQLQLGTSTDVE